MKKTFLLCLTASVLFLLESCSNKQDEEKSFVSFKATVNKVESVNSSGHSLMNDDYNVLKNGDKINLISNVGSVSSTTNYAIGDKLYWDNLNIDKQATSVLFTAVYPYMTIENPSSFKFNVLEADNKDLLCATPISSTTFSNIEHTLVFTHVMHKICLSFSSDGTYSDSDLSNMTVTLENIYPTAVIDLIKNKYISASGTKSEIQLNGKTSSAFIAPQEIYGTSIKISIAGNTITYKFPNEINGTSITNFESGKELTCNFTVKKDQIKLSSFSISDWKEQGTISDNIIIN